jgi:hypothetical protein
MLDAALPRVQVYLFTAGRTLYKLLQSLLRFDLLSYWMRRGGSVAMTLNDCGVCMDTNAGFAIICD